MPALIAALRESRVLSDEQLRRIDAAEVGEFPHPRDVLKDLAARGWLTRYQAKQIQRGLGAELLVGPYLLLERLGEGGMSHVFKALHQPMHRIVALKIVKPNLAADPNGLKRFRREVQIAAKLSHPHIVRVFDAADVGNLHYLAMEYIDGIDLTSLVRDSGPLPVATACEFVRQAALGLGHAHECELIHRDIKPSNLLVTRSAPEGVVKILDLGLARPLSLEGGGHQQVSALTIDGTVVGTPDFIAPEQAKNSHAIDFRADFYSLGCTFYFILTGRLPFPDGNALDKLIKHQLEEPYPVELIRSDVPPTLLPVLSTLLAKNPAERFQSGAEIAAALQPFCAKIRSAPGAVVNSEDSSLDSDSSATSDSSSVVADAAGSSTFRFDQRAAAAAPSPPRKSPPAIYLAIVAVVVVALGVIGIALAMAARE
jgi:eukaryotic-like serine/threonine-protein kinase